MVTRPFSSVIGMSYLGGFKNRFFNSLGQRWRKKIWAPLIDNTFNDGFWAKISIFFQLNEMRAEAKTWWLVSGYDVASSYFFKRKSVLHLNHEIPLVQATTVNNKTCDKNGVVISIRKLLTWLMGDGSRAGDRGPMTPPRFRMGAWPLHFIAVVF